MVCSNLLSYLLWIKNFFLLVTNYDNLKRLDNLIESSYEKRRIFYKFHK